MGADEGGEGQESGGKLGENVLFSYCGARLQLHRLAAQGCLRPLLPLSKYANLQEAPPSPRFV
jgi:hypothetical protein